MTPLSAEGRIANALKNLNGLTALALCEIAGELGIRISRSGLSQALSGAQPLSNNTGILMINLITRLEALSTKAEPLPLYFGHAKKIADLLRQGDKVSALSVFGRAESIELNSKL